MRLLAGIAFLLILFSCASTYTPPSPVHSVLLSCTAYSSALESLAVRRQAGLLDDEAIARVDELRVIATPICTADNPPAGAGAAIDGILVELEAILARAAAGDRA